MAVRRNQVVMVNGHESGRVQGNEEWWCTQAEKQQIRSVFFRKITIQDLSEQHLWIRRSNEDGR